MKNIKCKRCGEIIDAASGECPKCGAIYYVLTPDDADSETGDISNTRVFEEEISRFLNDDDMLPDGADAQRFRLHSAAPDEERPRRQRQETQSSRETQPIPKERYTDGDFIRQQNAQDRGQRRQQRDGDSPRHRTDDPRRSKDMQKSHTSRDPRNSRDQIPSERRRPDEDGERRPIDKRVFLVGGFVLLAALTIIICLLTGVFDFNKSQNDNFMPDVVGMKAETAKAMLETLGVKVEIMTEDSDEPKDTVLRQSAKVGKQLKSNEVIMLIVSTGTASEDEPDTFDAPSYIGMTYEQALRAAVSSELIIIKAADEYSVFPEGQIIKQDPLSGITVKKGDTIRVTVSRGVEPTPSPSPTPTTHTITVTAGKGGSISPKGLVSVADGGNQTFTITPDSGYEIREVKIDGVDVGPVASYTFTDVTKNHTIYAVFQAAPTPSPSTPSPPPSPITPPPTTTDPLDNEE